MSVIKTENRGGKREGAGRPNQLGEHTMSKKFLKSYPEYKKQLKQALMNLDTMDASGSGHHVDVIWIACHLFEHKNKIYNFYYL